MLELLKNPELSAQAPPLVWHHQVHAQVLEMTLESALE